VYFLLVLIELFSLGVTAEALPANIGSKSAISLQQGHPKFQVEWVASPTNHCSSTRLNDLSYGIKKSGQILLQFCHNPRVWQRDRQTDGRTDRQTDRQHSHRYRPRLHSTQRDNKYAASDRISIKFLVERNNHTIWHFILVACRNYNCTYRLCNSQYASICWLSRMRWNYAAVRAITPFKVIQGHRVWYQSKAHMRLPISDQH